MNCNVFSVVINYWRHEHFHPSETFIIGKCHLIVNVGFLCFSFPSLPPLNFLRLYYLHQSNCLFIHCTGGHFGLFMDSNYECLNILLSQFLFLTTNHLYFLLKYCVGGFDANKVEFGWATFRSETSVFITINGPSLCSVVINWLVSIWFASL